MSLTLSLLSEEKPTTSDGIDDHNHDGSLKTSLSTIVSQSVTVDTFTDVAAYCLTTIGTVVEIILRCLTARQLCKASKVCTFWNELAAKAKLKRANLTYRLVYVASKFPYYAAHYEDIDDDERDQENFMPRIQEQLTVFIEDTRAYPSMAILYLNRSKFFFGTTDGTASLQLLVKNVKRSLPPDCPLVGCLAGGVIGANKNGKDIKNEETEMTESASLVLLPSLARTGIRPFFLKLTDIRKSGKDLNRWSELLGFSKQDDIKLILLHACCEPDGIEAVINIILELAGKNVVIAGGVAHQLIFDDKLKSKGVVGIVFSGDLTANIVVERSTVYPDFKRALTFLKDMTPVSKNSIMLMYSTVARVATAYDKQNVETSLVAEVLPKVPTFGFVSYGAVGYEPLERSMQLERMLEDNVIRNYSTALCLLTIPS